MNIVNIEHINKIYGEKVIFHDASLGISEGDKIGIVGVNGTGKSTLLRIVAGEETPDSGEVVKRGNLKIAYLRQHPQFLPHATVQSYVDSFADSWKVMSNLDRLGITDYETEIELMSGGQRRKIAMAGVLAQDFDMLLLDEPTNHLDEAMISWLEDWLRNYRGTLLMVTHDRYFLDQVANKILEVSHGDMYAYEAGYSGFLELKAQREEMELATERKRKSVLRMELEWAKRGCRARSTKQKARLDRLEAMKNQTGPKQDTTVELETIETRMGKKTIELEHVSKAYGDHTLIKDYSYIFLKNQNIGIVGPNGCGKSTLVRMIAGLEGVDSGQIEIGDTIRIAYLAQEEQHLKEEQRVIDYVKNIGEYIQTKEGKISASQMLERFLFTPEMQYAPIGKLSGGEKRRLYLLGVLCRNCNVLLLDEAGNNLDIPTLTILEDFINSFSGIVIAVSHDRYFLDNVADRILEFDGQGNIIQYEGGYTDYLNKRNETPSLKAKVKTSAVGNSKESENAAGNPDSGISASVVGNNNGKNWKQNRPSKLKFSYKEEKEFQSIDEDIEKLENAIAEVEEDILKYATDAGRLNELTAKKSDLEEQLDAKMERWEYLNELAEKIEAQK